MHLTSKSYATSALFTFIYTLVLIICHQDAYAQAKTITGKVLNEGSTAAVPYVNIGLKKKTIGTVSDSTGHYSLTFIPAEVTNTDSIFFSAIGYQTMKVSFERFLNADKTIRLKESEHLLESVKITALPKKVKSYGRWSASLVFFPAMYKSIPKYSDEKGREQATILKIENDIFLRKLNFRINKRTFTKIKLRMNIYDVKDGIPNRPLLNQDVIFTINGSDAIGMPVVESIDLRPYQIQIKGRKEIALSLSILDLQSLAGDSSRPAFYVPSFPNPLRSSFYRMKGEAEWQKVSSSYLLVGLEAMSSKGDNIKDDEVEIENDAEVIKNDAKLSGLLYGNNKGQRIAVEDGEIYYETYGKGSPLILLHGNNESINSFRKQIEVLSSNYKVIAIDTRGHGNSINRSKSPYTYELFAKDLAVVMDALSLKKASLLGWSDGGNTALVFASQYPGKVEKMVIMGANLFPGAEAIKSDVISIFEKRRDSLMKLADPESENQLRITKLVLEQPHLNSERLKAITAPTLVLAGEFDAIKTEHTQLIHSQISNSKLVIIKGADHDAPLKDAKVFNQLVLDFLSSKLPGNK